MLSQVRNYFSRQLAQPIRGLHYLIMFGVVFECLVSNIMSISSRGQLSDTLYEKVAMWSHISIGMLLVIIAPIFIVLQLRQYGIRHFFPYLWGETGQLKQDIQQLKAKQLPEVHTKGIASCIQGLGLGALALVLFSGLVWFVMWRLELPLQSTAKDLHKLITTLIEAYVFGHGGFGLLHIIVKQRQ